MFFHPNGTVKKLVFNMKEGKHMLKNKRVVKALTIGLATVLATPSMTAFAAAPGDTPTADDNQADLTVDVVKEPVAVASENEQAIKDASKLTDDAQKAEQKVYNDAYFSQVPFDEEWNDDLADVALDEYDEQTRVVVPSQQFPGFKVVEPDDSANEFDENAGDHLDDASGILDQGEKDLTDKLEEFEEKIDEVNTAKDNADTAQANATAEAMKAEGAETAANAAGTSAAARPQEAIAKEAADKAAEYAGEAQDEATKSYNAYLEAKAKYEEAETIAKNANEAADKAVDASLEDAKVAAEFAKQAEKDAEALKVEMEIALAKARGTQAYYQGELTRIENRLNELASEKQQLDSDYAHAHAMYDKETQAWRDAFDAVSEARKALSEAPSGWDIFVDEMKVRALEKALVAAEKVLWDDGKAFFDANDKANSLKIKKELQDAYDLIKEAYEGKENQALKDAIQNDINVIDGNISTLKEKYGNNIGEIQDTLLSNTATDEAKETAIISLVNNISKLDNASRFDTELFDGALYVVTDAEGNKKFYTYKVENGVIKVAEVTENIQKIADAIIVKGTDGKTALTQAELELAIAAREEGANYVIVDKGETKEVPYSITTGYDITYTETTTETKDITRGTETKYDKYEQTGKLTVVVGRNYYGPITKTYDVEYYTVAIRNHWGDIVGWSFDWCVLENKGFYVDHVPFTEKFGRDADFRKTQIVLNNVEVTTTGTVSKTISVDEYDDYCTKTGFTVVKTNKDEGTNPVNVYNLYFNVGVEEGVTDLEALKAKIGEGNILKYEVTETIPGESVTKIKVMYNTVDTTKQHMNWYEKVTPEEKGFDFEEYDYTFDYGSRQYSVGEGTLKWNNYYGWEIAVRVDVWGNYVFKPISELSGNNSQKVVKFREVLYKTEEEVKAEKKSYTHGKLFWSEKEVQKTSDPKNVYTVYYSVDGSETPAQYSTSYTSGEFAGIDSLSDLNADRTNKSNNLGTVEDYNEKKAAYEEAKDEADAAWKKFVESKKNRDITGINLWKARKELNEAIGAKKKAEADLARAEWNFYWQDLKTAGAKAALDDITGKLAYNAGATAYNQGAKQIANMNLQAAKAKVGEYTYKANVAKKLAVDAKKARRAAVKAREAIKKIKASNLGADALEAAYAELEVAEQTYKDAQAAADLAAEEAKVALQAYNNVVNRINALVAAENAAAAGAGEGEGAGEATTGGAVVLTTVPTGEEVPGAPAAPAAGGAGVAANVAPAAVEAATTDITTPDTALAAAVPEDNKAKDDLTQIMPQAPALVADIADTEHLTWWWLLVVAVLGGTGYAMYKKFQTKKEEKVTK